MDLYYINEEYSIRILDFQSLLIKAFQNIIQQEKTLFLNVILIKYFPLFPHP